MSQRTVSRFVIEYSNDLATPAPDRQWLLLEEFSLSQTQSQSISVPDFEPPKEISFSDDFLTATASQDTYYSFSTSAQANQRVARSFRFRHLQTAGNQLAQIGELKFFTKLAVAPVTSPTQSVRYPIGSAVMGKTGLLIDAHVQASGTGVIMGVRASPDSTDAEWRLERLEDGHLKLVVGPAATSTTSPIDLGTMKRVTLDIFHVEGRSFLQIFVDGVRFTESGWVDGNVEALPDTASLVLGGVPGVTGVVERVVVRTDHSRVQVDHDGPLASKIRSVYYDELSNWVYERLQTVQAALEGLSATVTARPIHSFASFAFTSGQVDNTTLKHILVLTFSPAFPTASRPVFSYTTAPWFSGLLRDREMRLLRHDTTSATFALVIPSTFQVMSMTAESDTYTLHLTVTDGVTGRVLALCLCCMCECDCMSV